jgi:hypothetical protein
MMFIKIQIIIIIFVCQINLLTKPERAIKGLFTTESGCFKPILVEFAIFIRLNNKNCHLVGRLLSKVFRENMVLYEIDTINIVMYILVTGSMEQ